MQHNENSTTFEEIDYVTVTDLKQMGYCQRIVFYHYCLPGIQAARTFKMEAGTAANDQTEEMEHRRGLRAYGLKAGEREYDVWLDSPILGLNGRLDMLIRTPDEIIPVDYKNSTAVIQPGNRYERTQLRHNWEVQLAAYAMLIEERQLQSTMQPIQRGFLYYIPLKRAYPVEISTELRSEVNDLLRLLREMVRTEAMPDPTPVRGRCQACEFNRFCNDV